MRAGELEAEFADLNGWDAEAEAAKLLSELGVAAAKHASLMKELSDSEKVRVLMAQALFGNPGHPPAGRADQPPGRRLDPVAGGVPARLPEHRGGRLPRPALPRQGVHPHRRHRFRQGDALLRELHLLVRDQPDGARTALGLEQEEGRTDRGAEGVHQRGSAPTPRSRGRRPRERSCSTRSRWTTSGRRRASTPSSSSRRSAPSARRS